MYQEKHEWELIIRWMKNFEDLQEIRKSIRKQIKDVKVSKTQPLEAFLEEK